MISWENETRHKLTARITHVFHDPDRAYLHEFDHYTILRIPYAARDKTLHDSCII